MTESARLSPAANHVLEALATTLSDTELLSSPTEVTALEIARELDAHHPKSDADASALAAATIYAAAVIRDDTLSARTVAERSDVPEFEVTSRYERVLECWATNADDIDPRTVDAIERHCEVSLEQ